MADGPGSGSVALDLGDFDAVGVATEIVHALRRHAIEGETDAAATISAQAGWHRVVVTARRSGHVVLSVRYLDLSRSRWHNLSKALAQRGWLLDDDTDGATQRYPPGTEASAAVFETLAVLTLAGAPVDVREVTAIDGAGKIINLAYDYHDGEHGEHGEHGGHGGHGAGA